MRLLILIVALTGTWLIWSGLYKPLLLGLGVLSVSLTLWLSMRMGLHRKEVFALDLIPRLFGFWLTLLVDIVKSNFQVARIVLSPSLPISPTMVELKPDLEGQVARATMANCITLTPSTVTIDAHQGVILVHCLTEASAREQQASDMGTRLKRLLGDR
ncbi:MAG: Na+/H+ antiporter subunit E [Roseobacter sp.]|jgi:multicomponent Na+:H+ antiporter subunit E|nr:Na+/H+ antiporter subunit E [Roseobacter sp.]